MQQEPENGEEKIFTGSDFMASLGNNGRQILAELGENVYKSELRQEIMHIFYNLDRIFGGSGSNLADCYDSSEIKLHIDWALVGGKYQMDRVFLTDEQKEKIRNVLYKKFEENGFKLNNNGQPLSADEKALPEEGKESLKMADLAVVKPFKKNSNTWAIAFNAVDERQKRAYQLAIMNLKELKDLGVFHQGGVYQGPFDPDKAYQFFEMWNSDDDDPSVGRRLEALFPEIHRKAKEIYENAVSF